MVGDPFGDFRKAVTDANSNETDFAYSPDGALTTTCPNGDTVTAGYNNADQQTSSTSGKPSVPRAQIS